MPQQLLSIISRHSKILKYLISGGIAAITNLSILYVFTEYVHVWYLISSGFAFIGSFFVSFGLQKFWTFADASVHMIVKQLMVYFFVALINLGLNTLMMYGFVEYGDIHYILAQIITSAFIAMGSYFVYKHLIFKVETVSVLRS
jgi:putative flippase GtrA